MAVRQSRYCRFLRFATFSAFDIWCRWCWCCYRDYIYFSLLMLFILRLRCYAMMFTMPPCRAALYVFHAMLADADDCLPLWCCLIYFRHDFAAFFFFFHFRHYAATIERWLFCRLFAIDTIRHADGFSCHMSLYLPRRRFARIYVHMPHTRYHYCRIRCYVIATALMPLSDDVASIIDFWCATPMIDDFLIDAAFAFIFSDYFYAI